MHIDPVPGATDTVCPLVNCVLPITDPLPASMLVTADLAQTQTRWPMVGGVPFGSATDDENADVIVRLVSIPLEIVALDDAFVTVVYPAAAGAALIQSVPLLVNTLPLMLGATPVIPVPPALPTRAACAVAVMFAISG